MNQPEQTPPTQERNEKALRAAFRELEAQKLAKRWLLFAPVTAVLLMLTEMQTRITGTDLTALLRLRVALQAASMAIGATAGLLLFASIGPHWTVILCGLAIFGLAVQGWRHRPAEMQVQG